MKITRLKLLDMFSKFLLCGLVVGSFSQIAIAQAPVSDFSLKLDTSLNAEGPKGKAFSAPNGIDMSRTETNGYATLWGKGDTLVSSKFALGEFPSEGTLSFWIRPSATVATPVSTPYPAPTPSSQIILQRTDTLRVELSPGGTNGSRLVKGSLIYDTVTTSKASALIPPITLPTDSKWHQIAFEWNSAGDVASYLDGTPAGVYSSKISLENLVDNQSPIQISDSNSGYVGDFDELNIYPTILSATQIKAAYAAQLNSGIFKLRPPTILDGGTSMSLVSLNSNGFPTRSLNFGKSSEEKTTLFYNYSDPVKGLLSNIKLYSGHLLSIDLLTSTRNKYALISQRTFKAANVVEKDSITLPVSTIMSKIEKDGLFGRSVLALQINYTLTPPQVTISGINLAPGQPITYVPASAGDPAIVNYRSQFACGTGGLSRCGVGPIGTFSLSSYAPFGTHGVTLISDLTPSTSTPGIEGFPTQKIYFALDGVAEIFSDSYGYRVVAKQQRVNSSSQLTTCTNRMRWNPRQAAWGPFNFQYFQPGITDLSTWSFSTTRSDFLVLAGHQYWDDTEGQLDRSVIIEKGTASSSIVRVRTISTSRFHVPEEISELNLTCDYNFDSVLLDQLFNYLASPNYID